MGSGRQNGKILVFIQEDSSIITFSVKDLMPPTVSITFPEEDMLLKTGTTYQFVAETSSSSTVTNSWWEVNGKRHNRKQLYAIDLGEEQGPNHHPLCRKPGWCKKEAIASKYSLQTHQSTLLPRLQRSS